MDKIKSDPLVRVLKFVKMAYELKPENRSSFENDVDKFYRVWERDFFIIDEKREFLRQTLHKILPNQKKPFINLLKNKVEKCAKENVKNEMIIMIENINI